MLGIFQFGFVPGAETSLLYRRSTSVVAWQRSGAWPSWCS